MLWLLPKRFTTEQRTVNTSLFVYNKESVKFPKHLTHLNFQNKLFYQSQQKYRRYFLHLFDIYFNLMARKTKKHRECHKDDQQKNYGSHTRTKTLNLRKKKERNSVYRRVKVITEICKRLSCSQEISYSLLTVLRTKNLGAQRVDRGQAFHLSTILLKKAEFENCLSPL